MNERLDKYVFGRLKSVSRALVQKMIKKGLILVNGEIVKPGYILKSGDKVEIGEIPSAPEEIVPESFDLTVLYEDRACLVVDKPAGMVVHPGEDGRHMQGTVANRILDKLGGQGFRPGIVHRLDKDTSGCLLIAKNDDALSDLRSQFSDRRVEKYYRALVRGHPKEKEGIIDSPIGRSLKNRKKMSVVYGGRTAITKYRVIRQFKDVSLLEILIATGRTHQIRVHMAAIGHPVVGDKVYGRCRVVNPKPGRQFLHAIQIKFRSPDTGDIVMVKSSLPADLGDFLKLYQ